MGRHYVAIIEKKEFIEPAFRRSALITREKVVNCEENIIVAPKKLQFFFVVTISHHHTYS